MERNYTVKMSLHCLAVALFLATVSISVPSTLMAATGSATDGNPNGPPPIVRPQLPPDGNPNGPPPLRVPGA